MMATVKNFYISWKQQCMNFVSYSDCCGFMRDKSTSGAGDTGKENQPSGVM
jgi:hypothetical protein